MEGNKFECRERERMENFLIAFILLRFTLINGSQMKTQKKADKCRHTLRIFPKSNRYIGTQHCFDRYYEFALRREIRFIVQKRKSR